MTKSANLIGYGGSVLAGISLMSIGIAISDPQLERIFIGDSGHSLSWGTTLFRLLLVVHGLVLSSAALWRIKGLPHSVKEGLRSTERRFLAETETNRRTWGLLALLMVLGLILRLWRLNTDLWYDELLTLLNYVRLPAGHILSRLPDQNNHILFSLLSSVSVQIFGENSWAVRLPSVVFGVMSIWALFLLGRLVIGTRQALLASALITVSYHHIWFSQNARGYMALLFFSLLSTWLWLEALNRRGWSYWIWYCLAVTLGMLSHMTMLFVVCAHVAVYLLTLITSKSSWRNPVAQSRWKPFVAWSLCISLTLQMYALALPEFLSVGLHEVSLESEWTNPWWLITETVRNLRLGFVGVAGLFVGGALLIGGWVHIAKRDWRAAAVLVLPAVLAGGTVLVLGHNLWPRFFFFCMGFALLILIHGAMSFPSILLRWVRNRMFSLWPYRQPTEQIGYGSGLATAMLLIVGSISMLPRNYVHPKQDYSGARDYVESHRASADQVVAVGLAGIAYKRYFAPTWVMAQTHEELESARTSSGDNLWLVYTLAVEVKSYRPDVWQVIQNDFEIVKVFPGTLGGGEVFVCRPRSSNPLVVRKAQL